MRSIVYPLLIAVTIVAILYFTQSSPDGEVLAPPDSDMARIVSALFEYRDAYARYPSGDTKSILEQLSGNNERRKNFLSNFVHLRNGDFIDPWSTPYIISTTPSLVVRSAGKNKTPNDNDDVVWDH